MCRIVKSAVIPTIDSWLIDERENRNLIDGKQSDAIGVECSVNMLFETEYVAKLRPVSLNKKL